MKIRAIPFTCLCLLVWALGAGAGAESIRPPADAKCPVCGMFVAKYPDWAGKIVMKDGSALYFDGAKDLFKYWFRPDAFAPRKKPSDMVAAYVTEYYDMTAVDAARAFFVIGSDVYGPMGRELIPLKNRADAETFMADHKGRQIVTFEQVTPALVRKLD